MILSADAWRPELKVDVADAVLVKTPVFDIEKRVVVAPVAVVEAIAKSVVKGEEEAARIERLA